MEHRHQIGSVIHGDLGLGFKHRPDMAVVGIMVLALDGKDGNPIIDHEGGGNVILGRQGVRGAEHDIGPSGLEGFHEVGRLAGHMEAGRHLDALERFRLGKILGNIGQNRHIPSCPFDAAGPHVCQFLVLDIMLHSQLPFRIRL